MYIVLEVFGGPEYATIVTDESGNNKIFNNEEDAQKEANACQEGIVIEL